MARSTVHSMRAGLLSLIDGERRGEYILFGHIHQDDGGLIFLSIAFGLGLGWTRWCTGHGVFCFPVFFSSICMDTTGVCFDDIFGAS
jgi:hypothetical protein